MAEERFWNTDESISTAKFAVQDGASLAIVHDGEHDDQRGKQQIQHGKNYRRNLLFHHREHNRQQRKHRKEAARKTGKGAVHSSRVTDSVYDVHEASKAAIEADIPIPPRLPRPPISHPHQRIPHVLAVQPVHHDKPGNEHAKRDHRRYVPFLRHTDSSISFSVHPFILHAKANLSRVEQQRDRVAAVDPDSQRPTVRQALHSLRLRLGQSQHLRVAPTAETVHVRQPRLQRFRALPVKQRVAHNAARQKRRHNPTQIQHESSLPSSANRP